MSSGFVSGGTTEEPKERDAEWLKAQQELEEVRRKKAEESKQDGGKSLYEILQQNKTAKQDAFEESIRLKNQFRSLDEDEVEFLDSVLESTRTQEAAIKKETNEQLSLFHRQRQEADQALLDTSNDGKSGDTSAAAAGSPTEEEHWATTGRKRRRAKEKDALKGVKLRKSSSSGAKRSPSEDAKSSGGSTNKPTGSGTTQKTKTAQKPEVPEKSPRPVTAEPDNDASEDRVGSSSPGAKTLISAAPSGLGLGAYSSDED